MTTTNDTRFCCQECGRKFRTVTAAEKASRNGCPKCGGVDIDIDLQLPKATRITPADLGVHPHHPDADPVDPREDGPSAEQERAWDDADDQARTAAENKAEPTDAEARDTFADVLPPVSTRRARFIRSHLRAKGVRVDIDGQVIALGLDERLTQDTAGAVRLGFQEKPVPIKRDQTPRQALIIELYGVQTSFDGKPQVEQRAMLTCDFCVDGRGVQGEHGTVKRVGECDGWVAIEVELDKGGSVWPVFGIECKLETPRTPAQRRAGY